MYVATMIANTQSCSIGLFKFVVLNLRNAKIGKIGKSRKNFEILENIGKTER